MPARISAATMDQLSRDGCDWAFVDLGFAASKKSCGVLLNNGEPQVLRFCDLLAWISTVVLDGSRPLNLVLEAPLSVAFNASGNPTGRSVERRGSTTRYWYVGLGASVSLSAMYLLRLLVQLDTQREIRLIEGLASFKPKEEKSSHAGDVVALRAVGWNEPGASGCVVPPGQLKINETDVLISAFKVAGMDVGIPPVIVLGNHGAKEPACMI